MLVSLFRNIIRRDWGNKKEKGGCFGVIEKDFEYRKKERNGLRKYVCKCEKENVLNSNIWVMID